MFSLIVGRALIGVVKFVEVYPLELLESAFAIWAGEKRGEERRVVNLEVEVSQQEFANITADPELRRAVGRACIAKDMGAVPACECCGAAL